MPGYVVTYCMDDSPDECGGEWTSTGPHGPASGPYMILGDGSHGKTVATGGSEMAASYGTASASGTITARFTWYDGGDPENLPPAAVIIKETSTASWTSDWFPKS